MTPAGRPPRSDSNADKKVTIRLTADEHALLEKAAEPMYLSEWIRRTLFSSGDVLILQEHPEQAQQFKMVLTSVGEAFADIVAKIPEDRKPQFAEKVVAFKARLNEMFKLVLVQMKQQEEQERRIEALMNLSR